MNPSRKESLPHLKWETGDFSLQQILDRFSLPRVVQCNVDTTPVSVQQLSHDLTQPLLLYEPRVVNKIPARNLCIPKKQGKYIVVGDQLLIPEDYEGWFAILKKPGNKEPADEIVLNYTNTSELVAVNTKRFLVAGTSTFPAHGVLSGSTEDMGSFKSFNIEPGQSFHSRGIVHMVDPKKKTLSSKIKKKDNIKPEAFLYCVDDMGNIVYMSADQTGTFYSLDDSEDTFNQSILRMCEIVSKKCLPCVVKLLVGKEPVNPCSFTGILHLGKASSQTAVMAATITPETNIIEIPQQSPLKFRVALMRPDLTDSTYYRMCLDLCRQSSAEFMRGMKVCYKTPNTAKNGNDVSGHRRPSSEESFEGNPEKTNHSKSVKSPHKGEKSKVQVLESPDVMESRSPGRYVYHHYVSPLYNVMAEQGTLLANVPVNGWSGERMFKYAGTDLVHQGYDNVTLPRLVMQRSSRRKDTHA